MRLVTLMTAAVSVVVCGAGCLLDDGGVVGEKAPDAGAAGDAGSGSGSSSMTGGPGSGSGTAPGGTGSGSGSGSGPSGPSDDAGMGDAQPGAPVTVTCQSVNLAVLAFDAAPTELLVNAVLVTGDTVTPELDAMLTSVDILSGATLVEHFAGGSQFAIGAYQLLAGEINPPTAITQHCTDLAADRFDLFKVVVTGTLVNTGAAFSTTCSTQGGALLPTVVQTCHKNFDYPPLGDYLEASVLETTPTPPTFATSVQTETAIGAGGAIQSLASSLFVIPTDTSVGPENIPGFSATAAVETPANQAPFDYVSFQSSGNPFGSLCGWDAGQTPAFFIARFSGQNGYGAFSTEGIVPLCGVTQ
jgi:hypothetical protein